MPRERTTKRETVGARHYRYTAVFTPAEEGGFVVTVPALPGCVTEGDTLDEARTMAHEAIELYLESLVADGEEVPVEEGGTVTETIDIKISSAV